MADFKCPEQGCNKVFARQALLKQHGKRVHEKAEGEGGGEAAEFSVKVEAGDTEAAAYKCGACNESLDSEVAICPYCGEGLAWS